MAMSPEQMRKMSLAQEESERHARYAQADGSMRRARDNGYYVSPAIEAAGRRVNAATEKENESIGKPDPSPNNNIRF